jgi:hypothetical protein
MAITQLPTTLFALINASSLEKHLARDSRTIWWSWDPGLISPSSQACKNMYLLHVYYVFAKRDFLSENFLAAGFDSSIDIFCFFSELIMRKNVSLLSIRASQVVLDCKNPYSHVHSWKVQLPWCSRCASWVNYKSSSADRLYFIHEYWKGRKDTYCH